MPQSMFLKDQGQVKDCYFVVKLTQVQIEDSELHMTLHYTHLLWANGEIWAAWRGN